MIPTNLNHLYDSTRRLTFPINTEFYVPENDIVFTFDEVMKGVKLEQYIKKPSILGRKGYNPLHLLKIILFAFINDVRSTRKIASACYTDLRFIWLTQGCYPSHSTIATFIKYRLTDSIKNIFLEIMHYLIIHSNIDTSILYIDGTKFEANANKYSFVWKRAVIKFQGKLNLKITNEILKLNVYLKQTNYEVKNKYNYDELKSIVNDIESLIDKEEIIFVYGKGNRKHPYQRFYENFNRYVQKQLEYHNKIEICGNNRNSYAKSDNDATFMRMKEDYMRNGQLKPGYNIQIGVSDEYIMEVGVYQNNSDYKTFPKFLDSYQSNYSFRPQYCVGDAGYGGYENYCYTQEHGLELVQKYTMYSKEKESRFKKKIYNRRNFKKDDRGNFICPEDNPFIYERTHITKTKYPKKIDYYICLECPKCLKKSECTKAKNNRRIQIIEKLDEFEAEVRQNLESDFGIQLRINRSTQVEGAFGQIKENAQYRRISRRGLKNVTTEIILISIGYNLRKYHNKVINNLIQSYN